MIRDWPTHLVGVRHGTRHAPNSSSSCDTGFQSIELSFRLIVKTRINSNPTRTRTLLFDIELNLIGFEQFGFGTCLDGIHLADDSTHWRISVLSCTETKHPRMRLCLLLTHTHPQQHTHSDPTSGYLSFIPDMTVLLQESVVCELGLSNGAPGVFRKRIYDETAERTSDLVESVYTSDTLFVRNAHFA